jgi:hypothetical protein
LSHMNDSNQGRQPDQFELLASDEAFMAVKHIGEGHLFGFYVYEDDCGRRLSCSTAVKRGSSNSPEPFIAYARAFAEREARKADLID